MRLSNVLTELHAIQVIVLCGASVQGHTYDSTYGSCARADTMTQSYETRLYRIQDTYD